MALAVHRSMARLGSAWLGSGGPILWLDQLVTD
jgi:hypothetical protein